VELRQKSEFDPSEKMTAAELLRDADRLTVRIIYSVLAGLGSSFV